MTHTSAPVASSFRPGALHILAFKTSVWLNGLGVAVVIGAALDVVPLTLSLIWLRLPLGLFLAGILLAGLGLLWSGFTQDSLIRQALSGRARRTHWFSAMLATISYALALVVFAAGCWALVGVASLSHYYEDGHSGIEDVRPPGFQHPQNGQFIQPSKFSHIWCSHVSFPTGISSRCDASPQSDARRICVTNRCQTTRA